MTDSVIVAAPLLIATIVMAVRFVGCAFQTGGIPGAPGPTATDYSSTVTNIPSLVSYWRLNDQKPTTQLPPTAVDSIDSHNGTYQRTVALQVPGLANADTDNFAAQFDGQSGYVSVSPSTEDLNPSSFTIEVLVQPGAIDPDNRRTIVSSSDDQDHTGYILALNNTDFEAIVGTGTDMQTLPVHADVQPNRSYYVAMTYDALTLKLELYVEPAAILDDSNSQFDKTAFISADPNHLSYNTAQYPYLAQTKKQNDQRIGASTGGGPPAEFFQGTIQDVAVYNAALSFQDIATHYWVYKTGSEQPGESGPGPVAHPALTVDYAGAGANSYTIPEWCNYIDLILLGGGGGGANSIGLPGNGGLAGSWATKTLTRGAPGSDGIPWATVSLDVTVGTGGAAGTNGGDTSVTGNGMMLTAPGGAQGANAGTTTGSSPGTQIFNGTSYPTSGPPPAQSNPGADGNAPGGGGGGGAIGFNPGGAGAHGALWVVARQS